MKRIFIVAAVSLLGVFLLPIASPRADEVVPCEKSLADLRAAVDKATLSDADKAQVKALEDKGIERCNADDDKRADDFFAQAMKIIGK